MQKGDLEAAIASFTQSIQCHSNPAEVYVKRGLAYLQQDHTELALADFERAIAATPNHVQAHGYRGLMRYQLGDEEGALDDWGIALTLHPGDADIRYNRALVLATREHYEAALADLNIAIAHNPLMAEAYLHRGKIHQQLGHLTAAVQDWEIALCNDLRLEEAHQLLMQTQGNATQLSLQEQFADLLSDGMSLLAEQQGPLLVLTLHRPIGVAANYFQLPNQLRDRLVDLQIPECRRFRLIAKAGEASLSEWDQTYGIYDKAPCPPAHWGDALAATLLLFPPLGVVALVMASQVRPAYQRGDYPIAARASQAVKRLCLSSGALMGIMLFGLASYGVYTNVEGEYPNPGAKTAFVEPPAGLKKEL
jgi:tetratricopeptide (TPR) repeat protein